MSNASRDDNFVPSIIAILESDGLTIIPLVATPAGYLIVSNGTTGTAYSAPSRKDENNVSTLLAVSETDGTTPIPLQSNSSGRLLVDSS